jgi:hypothetical protein
MSEATSGIDCEYPHIASFMRATARGADQRSVIRHFSLAHRLEVAGHAPALPDNAFDELETSSIS